MVDPVALTVGGFFISAFLQVFFDRIATWEFLGYFKIGKLDAEKFRQMKLMFSSANLVLNHAEHQQLTNPMVKEWLADLQEVIYDTQDIIYRNDQNNILNAVKLNEEITEILIRLENIVKQKDHLSLKFGFENRVIPRPQTTSLVEETGIYGRDTDKEAIIELLLSNEMNGKKAYVIPIVGMSGIGKTALAQLVYNEIDDRIKERPFDFKVWVSVTNEFDIFRITKTIAKTIFPSQTFEDNEDLNFIQVRLQNALMNKKILIVLDDVWVENYSLWSEFKKPFSHAGYGSEIKIIVTTQSEKVACMVHDLPPHHLTSLSDDACWNLFKKVALGDLDQNMDSKLEETGKEIVKKCKGLPLAVKSLGGLLRHQPNLKEWKNVLASDIWELSQKNGNILPPLWLSYQYLPAHLKQCFAYCAIFPRGFEFDKEDLIKLWMAEDLLQLQNHKRLEEVGEDYFEELLSRSFFQKSIEPVCFTMHDLVSDLASFLVGDFCLGSNSSTLCNPPRKIRHWSHFERQSRCLKDHEDLEKYKQLRTLMLVSDNLDLENLLPSLTCLRVLSLRDSKISRLPDSIEDLKILRYLNLSYTNIKEIPKQVCLLYNLQTLLLQYCFELKSLPIDIHKLQKLRHLNFEGTDLEGMPTKMDNLKDLQTLSRFILGKDDNGSTTMRELQNFQNLGGSLHILRLEIVNVEDISEAKLENMKYLTELEYEWSFSSDVCAQNQEDVLERMQPHSNIKILTIKQWEGKKFPKWVGDRSFCNLEKIQLVGCRMCALLPPLGMLPLLKHLVISEFYELSKIDDEFYYGDSSEAQPFRRLETLQVSKMRKWKDWSFPEGKFKDSFPALKQLVLKASPILNAEICLPETIETVEIRGCRELNLKFPGRHQNKSLTKLHVSDSCHSMESLYLDLFEKLEELDLSCGKLKSLAYSERSSPPLPFLKSLKLTNCLKFERFPQGLRAPSLEKFDIHSCKNLGSLPPLPLSLKTLIISECPELESFSENGLPKNISDLTICGCEKLFEHRLEWNLQALTKLSNLRVSNIDKELDPFPEDGLLPITLTNLSIKKFTNLKKLNGNALQCLTSLGYLTVSDCGELECLPDEGLPASVMCLDICKSEKLIESYKRGTEEYRNKFSRIPQLIEH